MNDGYTVRLRADGADFAIEVDAVAICAGLHQHPRRPSLPGAEAFRGTTLHASEYKEPSIFRGKRVVVVGSGETAFDVAYAYRAERLRDGGAGMHRGAVAGMETARGCVAAPPRGRVAAPPRGWVAAPPRGWVAATPRTRAGYSEGRYAAASHGATAVSLSTRRGFVSVPASFGENVAPLDCIIMNAGTHASARV